jgi:tetratricopeptide (TPR) repeat protein
MRIKERLLIAVLLAAVALAYGNILVNQFTMDDELYILRNPQVTNASTAGFLSPNKFTNVFRPVTFASLAMNWEVGGTDPAGYHLVNLLLHAGVTCLLFFLLQALLSPSPKAKIVAFVGALLFAVHPIHTEAVSSAVGRAELLAAGFLMAGWLLHLRDQKLPALLCFVLALLSKESAIVFLPLVVLGDYARAAWKPWLRYAAMAGITLAYLGLLWKMQGGRFGQPRISLEDNPLASLSVGWRILNALHVAWMYAALHFYPAVLSCDYSFNQIRLYADSGHALPWAAATIVALGVWLWAVRKRRSEWILAGGIYLAGFAITSNILVPTGTIMGERLAYFPSVGFCLLIALLWVWLHERQSTAAWTVLGALLVVLAMRTAIRNRDWKDNFALFTAAEHASPGSAKVHANLGSEYMERKQFEQAGQEFQTALRINPDSPDTLAVYGLLESWQGNYQKAGAMMEKALYTSGRDNPHYDSIVVNFAIVLVKTNHPDGALDLLNQEVSQSPAYAPGWSNRAMLHLQNGKREEARSDAEAALRLNPEDAEGLEVMNRLANSSPATGPR